MLRFFAFSTAPPRTACLPLLFLFLTAGALAADPGTEKAAQIARGAKVYAQACWTCHQTGGQGLPGAFPPLAGSDYLMEKDERIIRDLILGLSGEITVNGVKYNGVMPPSGLDDGNIADVLTYARNAWENKGAAISPEQVRKVRAELALNPENAAAMQAGFPPLPDAPPGFTLEELAQMPEQVSRLSRGGSPGEAFALSPSGNVWRIDTASGAVLPAARADDYLEGKDGVNCMGLTFDRSGRLYIVSNRQDRSEPVIMNRVTIYRTSGPPPAERVAKPEPWLRASYPWGIGPFNHGAGHIALGPDGMLYCGSGSRTDGNEPGDDPRLAKTGEHELTACLWRLDPAREKPEVEVFARGLRNPYGFCWTPAGEMFATENGPDADAPEELNVIEKGAHYGFPYQFSNWIKKAYPYSPDAPAGLAMTLPVLNAGPDGGARGGPPLQTFEAHSCPAGICWLDDSFPERYRGSFLIARFGNMLPKPRDTGFDLVLVKAGPPPEAGRGFRSAQVQTLLAPLARPVDVLVSGPGTVLVAEYSRAVTNSGSGAMLPGRILKLQAVK